jgi:hypothetical protein|uniref:Uncharacterized protein n=1 Tax=Cyanidiaceae sp. MX-AZ01 TaxID=1503164 RepID=A0A060A9B7_9RHOD|nr:hypothetical protein [Cyanidiaceae sp. MX-AZ01]
MKNFLLLWWSDGIWTKQWNQNQNQNPEHQYNTKQTLQRYVTPNAVTVLVKGWQLGSNLGIQIQKEGLQKATMQLPQTWMRIWAVFDDDRVCVAVVSQFITNINNYQ